MDDRKIDDLHRNALAGRLSRREVLRRVGALGLSLPVVSALLAACGGEQGEAPAPAQRASPGASPVATGQLTRQYAGTTIRWSGSLAEDERAAFDRIILPDFAQKTGIQVEFLQIEAADFVRQLQAQVQAGRVEVDLFAIDNNSLAPLVDNQLIEDLTQYEDIIPPETISSLLPVLRFNDTLYFLPYRPNVQIVYYNTGEFTEAGLQPPQTWDELMNVAKTFSDREEVGRVALQGASGSPVGVTVTEFIWQAGGDPLVLNGAQSQQAFQYLQGLNRYLSPQTATAKFDTMNTYLANSSVYLGPNWPFGVNVIVRDAGRQDIHSYPGWSGPAAKAKVLGGEVLGVPKESPNRDAAIVFAQYLMSKDTQEMLTRELAWPAVRSDAFGTVADWQKPYFESVRLALENAKARPNVVYWREVERIMSDAWSEIVSGGAPVKETLDRYQQQVEQVKQQGG